MFCFYYALEFQFFNISNFSFLFFLVYSKLVNNDERKLDIIFTTVPNEWNTNTQDEERHTYNRQWFKF